MGVDQLPAAPAHAEDCHRQHQRHDGSGSPADLEAALALLKGLSHKTIAKWSGRSERTVRQHAVAVYRKSGLEGRAELSAFFLEGLLLPQAELGSEDR